PLSNLTWLVATAGRGPGPRPLLSRAALAVRGLRLPHYLALGAQGLVAGFAWLALPTALPAAGSQAPPPALPGAPPLVLALPWTLMAQARLAAEGRFGAAFELRELRRRIARAPIVTALALVVTLGPALPLYLLKIEPVSRDALWLPALVFLPAL